MHCQALFWFVQYGVFCLYTAKTAQWPKVRRFFWHSFPLFTYEINMLLVIQETVYAIHSLKLNYREYRPAKFVSHCSFSKSNPQGLKKRCQLPWRYNYKLNKITRYFKEFAQRRMKGRLEVKYFFNESLRYKVGTGLAQWLVLAFHRCSLGSIPATTIYLSWVDGSLFCCEWFLLVYSCFLLLPKTSETSVSLRIIDYLNKEIDLKTNRLRVQKKLTRRWHPHQKL